jgi:CPA1 family monovalent cation:H+ antiporter
MGVGRIQLLLVVFGAIAVSALAHRRGLQPALVVVVLASAVSFIPGIPRFDLPPELILSVVLPPLLYSAALNFSFFSFARNLRPILSLGVGLVVVTTLVTGAVATWVVPGLALVPAFVLGAVVSPPDAVAGLAIGRKLGLPKRLTAILTGESLVNDAAALTIFSFTIAAATGGHTLFGNPLLLFAYQAAVGVAVGLALGLVVQWIRARLRDSGLETALGMIVPFAAYLFAEHIHASGVLAVVAAGFTLGHNDANAGFATRLQGRGVWKSLDVMLESFVFAYMGLRCKFVFTDLAASGVSWFGFVLGAVAVLLAVLLVRPLWVLLIYGRGVARSRLLTRLVTKPRNTKRATARAQRLKSGSRLKKRVAQQLPWRYAVIISWTGMRGVVTLAAAAGVPLLLENGDPFPARDTIQALAFVVAVGTLLCQGTTLPWLIRKLRISAPQEQLAEAREIEKSREITQKAARNAMDNLPEDIDPQLINQLRQRVVDAVNEAKEYKAVAERGASAREAFIVVRRAILAAQREALVRARDAGELDDDVMRNELARLDYQEAASATEIA